MGADAGTPSRACLDSAGGLVLCDFPYLGNFSIPLQRCQHSERLTMQRFGAKLRTLRKQRGMTIIELADAIGYAAYSHVSEIETGKREPSLRFVLKVAHFFNVTTDQLLRDDLEVGTGADEGA